MKIVLNRAKSLKYIYWFRFVSIYKSIEEKTNDINYWNTRISGSKFNL